MPNALCSVYEKSLGCQEPTHTKLGGGKRGTVVTNLDLPQVSIRSLGGTIAMVTPETGGGATPSLNAQTLVDAVPALLSVATVEAASVGTIPGASLEIAGLLTLHAELERACLKGSRGAVVTQGTDTLEETAYLLDLLWRLPQPLVFTGAMRAADSPGADGPANLLAAVAVAASERARRRGCLVVMNDEIHLARTVRKTHTTSPAAFGSPATGPVGHVQEGAVRFYAPQARRHTLDLPSGEAIPTVALIPVALGADTGVLDHAAKISDGLVIQAYGGGHVPSWWVAPLLAAAQRIPVVITSRTGSGTLLKSTYGFSGAERGLLEGGLISAVDLDGPKARLLLILIIMTSLSSAAATATFARHVQNVEAQGYEDVPISPGTNPLQGGPDAHWRSPRD